jgi:hypothetical protein
MLGADFKCVHSFRYVVCGTETLWYKGGMNMRSGTYIGLTNKIGLEATAKWL